MVFYVSLHLRMYLLRNEKIINYYLRGALNKLPPELIWSLQVDSVQIISLNYIHKLSQKYITILHIYVYRMIYI